MTGHAYVDEVRFERGYMEETIDMTGLTGARGHHQIEKPLNAQQLYQRVVGRLLWLNHVVLQCVLISAFMSMLKLERGRQAVNRGRYLRFQRQS